MIIGEGANFGAVLSYEKSSQMAIELTYSYQKTTFNVKDYYNFGASNLSGTYNGSVSYIMIGASHSPDFSAKIAPYGGMMLGGAIFTAAGASEEWKFAVGGKLGAVIHINEKFGIHSLPTKILVDPNGKIIGRYTGDEGRLDVMLKKVFGE